MTPTLRAELDRIDEFLNGPEGAELALVLSAIRGPDIPHTDEVKYATTNHIRRAAFPKTCCNENPAGWDLHLYPFNAFKEEGGWHFKDHIVKAATVLGLIP